MCRPGLRELGKNWAEVAGRVGSKTATECRRFYLAERQKLALDDLVADYHASQATDLVVVVLRAVDSCPVEHPNPQLS